MHALFDIETNGLLNTLDRIHCLVIRDVEPYELDKRQTWIFRRHEGYTAIILEDGREVGPLTLAKLREENPDLKFSTEERPPEDTIDEGINMLLAADKLVGHNIVGFDIKAIVKLYDGFEIPLEKIADTLVISRMLAPDVALSDYVRQRRGELPGKLIGSHSLDAWGHRLGRHKGDYSISMMKLNLDPWAAWNKDMEDYCVNDIDVNEILWESFQRKMPPERALELEHDIHQLGTVISDNGFPFDQAQAVKLKDQLDEALRSLSAEVSREFGFWYAPDKKYVVRAPYLDPDTPDNSGKTYQKPRPEWGESSERAIWAEMTFPKKNRRSLKLGDLTVDAPYCKIKKVEFNPGSRHHIVDRFTTVYGWKPTQFTEKGFPQVDDAILNQLVDEIPMAKPLAKVLFYNKILGQLANGPEAWLRRYNEATGCVHHYINTGGTVSSRCSHNSPNLGQVASVIEEKVLDAEGKFNKEVVNPVTGEPYPECFDAKGKPKKKVILLGEPGGYGFECRDLFYTPRIITSLYEDDDGNQFEDDEEWVQVGIDLSGIEFRALAEECAPFDHGELIEVVLSGDIHAYNMEKTGITNRTQIKRLIYALMYGAGDWKLGSLIEPYADEATQRRLGAQARATLMAGLPALKKAIDKAKDEASTGYLKAIDGRLLRARSTHSALNLRLQSHGALIAKKWVTLINKECLSRGWRHGWRGDYAMLAFVHDELQTAIKKKYADEFMEFGVAMAGEAGRYFGWRCPIDAQGKLGHSWAECH